jgi:hypothetical protein
MKSHINFGEDTEGDTTYHEIQGFDIKCKKCGHESVEIEVFSWFSEEEGSGGTEVKFHCNKCDVDESIEEE